nr:hypothetical protein [Candidatus Magnetaquicoccus inordinatus]
MVSPSTATTTLSSSASASSADNNNLYLTWMNNKCKMAKSNSTHFNGRDNWAGKQQQIVLL